MSALGVSFSRVIRSRSGRRSKRTRRLIESENEPAGFGHPVRSGDGEVPAAVAGYTTQYREALNPLMAALEERWLPADGSVPPEGGLVTPILGCAVLTESVEADPGT